MADQASVLHPSERINSALDKIEGRLPTVPRRFLQLNRAVAALGCNLAGRAASALNDSGEVVADAASMRARTVTGQARSVVDRTVTTASDGISEVAGQARAQSELLVDTIEQEAAGLAEDAETVTDDMAQASYTSWTRSDLYERAQELDIEGRSTMNKAELIDALTAASTEAA